MKIILRQFLTDFIDRDTRKSAFANLMLCTEQFSGVLTQAEIKDALSWSVSFSRMYSESWPWQKNKIVAKAFRELQ